MKQFEAVIEVMKKNGGYATLGFLYQETLKIPNVVWKSKTPFATIRRIVQDERFFFKIRPGLWALKAHKHTIPPEVLQSSKAAKEAHNELNHTYFQGLLLDIGNLKKYETFVPHQDKNKIFLKQPLKSLASLESFYPFTYAHILDKAKTIDVTWFNTRKMPQAFFEIEHSTDFRNSLLKFVELQDFNVDFRIVADKARERQFQSALAYVAFRSIAHRVKFLAYDIVSELHTKTFELTLLENTM